MPTFKKIIFIVNSDWFFLLHILPVAKEMKNQGHQVCILSPDTGEKSKIISEGFDFINLPLDRRGINPIHEVKTILKIYRVCKAIQPDLLHLITIKPIFYGSLVAKWFKIPVINTICGLGYSFLDQESIKFKIALFGYKKSLSYLQSFSFFENQNDCELFRLKGVVSKKTNYKIVNGIGANLNKYRPNINASNSHKIVVTMASRMLWQKGVGQFVDAAISLHYKYNTQVVFKLYGKIDKGNPGFVPKEYLENKSIKNYLNWYGFESDMKSVFNNTDIMVLPSYYREGCPMVLMEACAAGLPIITTDSVGCRECVEDGINGFKIPIKDSKALVEALEKLILDEALRKEFGQASRKLAERKFDQKNIVKQYIDTYKLILKS